MNYFYDYSRLRGRIVEKLGTLSNFADKVTISEVSLYSKLSNKTEFKQNEIYHSCEILEIPITEASEYFFKVTVKKS